MDMNHEMEGELHRTTWLLWIKGVTPLDIRLRLSAVCGEREYVNAAVCSTGIISSREGKAKAAVNERHCDTAEERFLEAIGKLPER